jgi:hypothetical protein
VALLLTILDQFCSLDVLSDRFDQSKLKVIEGPQGYGGGHRWMEIQRWNELKKEEQFVDITMMRKGIF